MSREQLIMWKAIEKGWQTSDLKRVDKKLHALYTEFCGSIQFKNIEELALMLDEPVDYKLEWSLIRLCKDAQIDVFKKDGSIFIDILPQQPEGRLRHTGEKEKNAKHSVQFDSEYIEY